MNFSKTWIFLFFTVLITHFRIWIKLHLTSLIDFFDNGDSYDSYFVENEEFSMLFYLDYVTKMP